MFSCKFVDVVYSAWKQVLDPCDLRSPVLSGVLPAAPQLLHPK